jgi:hypothetical protein
MAGPAQFDMLVHFLSYTQRLMQKLTASTWDQLINGECRNLFNVMLNVFMPRAVMLNVVMLSVIMLSVVMLNVVMLSVGMLNVIMLSVVRLNVVRLRVVWLSVVMLSVVMLSVGMPSAVMLNVVMLNVVMLSVVAPKIESAQWSLKLTTADTVVGFNVIEIDKKTKYNNPGFESTCTE